VVEFVSGMRVSMTDMEVTYLFLKSVMVRNPLSYEGGGFLDKPSNYDILKNVLWLPYSLPRDQLRAVNEILTVHTIHYPFIRPDDY
jgi:hypothetical protein